MQTFAKPLAALLLISAAATPAAFAAESAYTDLDLDRCQKIAEHELGVSLKCKGYKGYPVYFAESDLRQSVFFGHLGQAIIDDGFESFSPFNRVNTKVEWRLDGTGRPFAAILRWFIENPNDQGIPTKASEGQVLVISKVAQQDDGIGCVVGYVDALVNKDANSLARQVADTEAQSFGCGYNESFWYGKRGDKSGEPTHNLPEGLSGE